MIPHDPKAAAPGRRKPINTEKEMPPPIKVGEMRDILPSPWVEGPHTFPIQGPLRMHTNMGMMLEEPQRKAWFAEMRRKGLYLSGGENQVRDTCRC